MVAREKLSDEEMRVLARLRLRPDDVEHVGSLPKQVWTRGIRDKPITLILRQAGRCTKNREHRLCDRGGHCVQCDTKTLGFQLQRTSDRYVYIAGSFSTGLVKIGNTDNWTKREKTLRRE